MKTKLYGLDAIDGGSEHRPGATDYGLSPYKSYNLYKLYNEYKRNK
jgi:hypothetical protein